MQFAGVEQQLKSNEQLKALIAIEKSAQSTNALIYVGNTVAVDGSTQQFNGSATWNLKAEKSTTAAITITNSTGQTVYSGNFTLTEGKASFVWDGKGNDGTQWPAGAYKLTATGKDSTGKDVGIATEIQGVVDSVDLTATPAAALDRRPELHHRSDQARDPSDRARRLRKPRRRASPIHPNRDPCPARRLPDAGPQALAVIFKEIRIEALSLGKF